MLAFMGVGTRRPSTIPAPGTKPTSIPIDSSPDGRPRLVSKEGYMSKEGEVWKTINLRYFKLAGTTLSYYTEKEVLKGVIPLQGAILRESHRKGMELGFELVVNPSPASLQGALLLGSHGELGYATGASPTHGHHGSISIANSSTENTSNGGVVPEERVYYLNLPPTPEQPSLAQQQRKEWIEAIQNNIQFDSLLNAWLIEKTERFETTLAQARKEVESVRAEREVWLLNRRAEEDERRAKERETDTATAAAVQAQEEKDLTGMREKSPKKSSACCDDPSSSSASSSAEDAALTSGSLSAQETIALLKRKNVALEAQVRMILTENETLKQKEQSEITKLAESIVEQRVTFAVEQIKRDRQKIIDDSTAQIQALKAQLEQAQKELTEAQLHMQTQSLTISQMQSQSQSQPSPSSPHHHDATDSPAASNDVTPTTPSAVQRAMHSRPGSMILIPPHGTTSLNTSNQTSPTKQQQQHQQQVAQAMENSMAGPLTSSQFQSHQQPAPALSAPQSHVALNNDKCLCQCLPPCVSFLAHKGALVQVNALDNRLAALAMERQQLEGSASRYRTEKKVLKQEVIRLRALLQVGTTAPATPTSNA